MAFQQSATATKSGQNTLRSVIRKITLTKLEELKTEKDLMTKHYGKVLEKVNHSTNNFEKLSLLHSALKETPVAHCDEDKKLETTLWNLDVLLKTIEEDPSVSPEYLQHMIQELNDTIVLALKKCEYSFLYGSVLSDWFESEEIKNKNKTGDGKDSGDANGNEFEVIDVEMDVDDGEESDKSKTIHEMRQRFFVKEQQNSGFNKEKFTQFLTKVFSFEDNIEHLKSWDYVKNSIFNFGNRLIDRRIIEPAEIIASIKGLLGENLFTGEKRQALRDLQENSVAISELSTLLTSQLRNLKRWDWPEDVVLDIRREISGRFRAFMDEDLITGIFLQFIGAAWASHLRANFINLYYANVKLKDCGNQRRKTIANLRKRIHKDIFLADLPSSVQNQRQNLPYNPDAEDCTNARNNLKSVIQAKHHLLHFLSAEIQLNSILRPESNFLALQTDFEWFGPSLNHEAILTLLEFIHVPKPWLEFFRRFLQAPLKFPGEDEVNRRSRGVPISHCLSMVFGESLLFLMDFHVNRTADIDLHRMYDDILLWHHDEEKMTKAWQAMQEFANITGLKFNEEKSASVKIFKGQQLKENPKCIDTSQSLPAGSNFPQGHITWGFLKLDSDGIFRIDLPKLEPKMKEMEKMLAEASCVMDWVNVYNKYFGFFIRNCGSNAIVFGEQHIDQIISAVGHIHKIIFRSTNGNPKAALINQFSILKGLEILDAWIYWPANQGGLGLKNPLLELLAVKESEDYKDSSTNKAKVHNFDDLPEIDKLDWEKACEKLKEAKEQKKRKYLNDEEDEEDELSRKSKREKLEEGFTFEEYCANRETRNMKWFAKFHGLLDKPDPGNLKRGKLETTQFNTIFPSGSATLYESWLFSYYAKQLRSQFGNLEFINTKLIPMSMVSEMTNSRLNF